MPHQQPQSYEHFEEFYPPPSVNHATSPPSSADLYHSNTYYALDGSYNPPVSAPGYDHRAHHYDHINQHMETEGQIMLNCQPISVEAYAHVAGTPNSSSNNNNNNTLEYPSPTDSLALSDTILSPGEYLLARAWIALQSRSSNQVYRHLQSRVVKSGEKRSAALFKRHHKRYCLFRT